MEVPTAGQHQARQHATASPQHATRAQTRVCRRQPWRRNDEVQIDEAPKRNARSAGSRFLWKRGIVADASSFVAPTRWAWEGPRAWGL